MTHIRHSAAHLFSIRSKEELGGWVRRLRYFRYARSAPSPFPGEPDEELVAAVIWETRSELEALLDALGAGRSFLPSPPTDLGWTEILGGTGTARLVLFPGRLEIVVSGAAARRSRLVESDLEVAESIERLLDELDCRMQDPPRMGPWVLSPMLWPEVWEALMQELSDSTGPGGY